MKHRSKYRAYALLCAVALLPLVAWAAEPAAGPAAEPRTAAPTAASAPKMEKDAPCARTTGSRIKPVRSSACPGASQMTRSYSKRDIETTGEIDLAEALRKIDPIFH